MNNVFQIRCTDEQIKQYVRQRHKLIINSGLAVFIILVLMGVFDIKLKTSGYGNILTFVVLGLMLSAIVALILRWSERNQLRESYLVHGCGTVTYHMLRSRTDQAIGNITIFHTYYITNIAYIKETKFNYIVYGDIELTIQWKKSIDKIKLIKKVKIPKCFKIRDVLYSLKDNEII